MICCPLCQSTADLTIATFAMHVWQVHPEILSPGAKRFTSSWRAAFYCPACPSMIFNARGFGDHAYLHHSIDELISGIHAKILNIQPEARDV